jgi:hypothetical protein
MLWVVNMDNLLSQKYRHKIIACETVIEEMLPFIPPDMKYEVLDFGLHIRPEELKKNLQEVVNSSSKEADVILLGYGLCSQAVVGLRAENSTLIVPRVDDCIAIFLGSVEEYKHQHNKAPGTYYLTKGWIKVGDTPFDEYDSAIIKYGKAKADSIYKQILKNYTRLAFINTGDNDLEYFRDRAQNISRKFNLQYEEITGSRSMTNRLIYGPWNDDFIIAEPGKTISFLDFRRN